MMRAGLQVSIPQRLSWIRLTVTLSLIISIFLSMGLWSGSSLFPDAPLFRQFHLNPTWDLILTLMSVMSLLISLFAEKRRLFLLLTLLINITLVLSDLNRLQPWFYIYNAILLVLLFYDGRVDNPGKYNSTFTIIQFLLASVYIFNGMAQLNPEFIHTDFHDTISPLAKFCSERQFTFLMKFGTFVPWCIIFTGFGLLIRPARYLAVFCAWLFHLAMFILLFPSTKNDHYALWFMNLSFGLLVFFLFSGKTRERFFSWTILTQKPVFYLVLFGFWIAPAAQQFRIWPQAPSFSFLCGKNTGREVKISEETYSQLPLYLRHFCHRKDQSYSLNVNDWCRHELRSECTGNSAFDRELKEEILQLTSSNVKETEEALSSL